MKSAEATAAAMRAAEPLVAAEPLAKDGSYISPAGPGRRPRTTLEDPTFLETFSRASRLAFIGSWRERWDALLDRREEELGVCFSPSTPPPPAAGRPRVVLHVDLDCFFASVAARKRPELAGRPLAVCWTSAEAAADSNSEISSANYAARREGVNAGMWLGRAKELCPSLVTVPFEFDEYARVATEVYECVLDVSPYVRGLSIDECYVDATEAAYHDGATETRLDDAPDADADADADAADEAAARAVAERIRTAVVARTGCTVSVGSGPNCLLARVATTLAKPDGHVHLSADAGARRLAGMPCSCLPGVGPERFAVLRAAGFETCADVADAAEGRLGALVGPKLGKEVKRFARGADDRAWEAASRAPRKSVGAQCSWGVRCRNEAHVLGLVHQLVAQVESRAKRLGVLAPRRLRAVTVKVWRAKEGGHAPKGGVGHGGCDILSRSAPVIDAPTESLLGPQLRSAAEAALHEVHVTPDLVRGLGVSVQLHVIPATTTDQGQRSITTFFQDSATTTTTTTTHTHKTTTQVPNEEAASGAHVARPAPSPPSRTKKKKKKKKTTTTTKTTTTIGDFFAAASSPPREEEDAPSVPAKRPRLLEEEKAATKKKNTALVGRRRPPVVLVAVGIPGSGKSTLWSDHLRAFGVDRACQDELKRRETCEARVAAALAAGRSIYVDRTNLDAQQRSYWLALASAHAARCVALVFRAPVETCVDRCRRRDSHEAGLDKRNWGACAKVVKIMNGRLKPIARNEPFDEAHDVPTDPASLRSLLHRLLDDGGDAKPLTTTAPTTTSTSEAPRAPPPPTLALATGTHDEYPPPWNCAVCTLLHENAQARYLSCEACQTPHASAPP